MAYKSNKLYNLYSQLIPASRRLGSLLLVVTIMLATLVPRGKATDVMSLEDHSYAVIYVDPPMTWVVAHDSAASLGGYLATITSQEEQDFVAGLLSEGDTAWLGATDMVVEGNWIWWTGEGFTFGNWLDGHPEIDSLNDHLQIIHADSGQWRDFSGQCNAFIVEWDCCSGNRTGNVNCDAIGKIDILDVTRLIDYLYITNNPLCCLDEANIDGDQALNIDLVDVVRLIEYIYGSHRPTAPCPSSGSDHPADSIILVDQSGKSWNVTNAVNFFGLDTFNFNFALGPGGHPAITEPEFYLPGDSGYPAPGETFSVIGVSIGNEHRAYPLSFMHYHEVVDDVYDSASVAVAY